MHASRVALLALLFQGLCSTTAIAQSDEAAGGGLLSGPTRIAVDQDQDQILFYVENEVAAVLRADGLHVRDDINFGGVLTDYGRTEFRELSAPEDADQFREGGAHAE